MIINSDPTSWRKNILKDPATAFIRAFPENNIDQATHFNNLCAQYETSKQQRQEMLEQSRQLSSLIGQAKREARPVEPLKEQMQEISSRIKILIEELKAIEDQIISIFESPLRQGDDEQQLPSQFNARNYRGDNESIHDVTISLLTTEQQEWNDYVNKNPAASIYHLFEWQEIIRSSFDHQALYFVARDDAGKIVGILPLIRLKSLMFGDFLVSMPYFNYGGAVADQPIVEQQLMATANSYAEQKGINHIEYRDDIPRVGMPVREDKVNMLLALPGTEEDLWNNFTPKLRAQIKRPLKESPEVLGGGIDLLTDFYSVFARNMRDLGTPVYPKVFFYNILNTFTLQSRIMVIRCNGRAVAAAFLIGHKNTLEIPWASALKEVNHLSLNMLMYWEILRFAIKEGYRYFDFGRSSLESGTYRFKQQWGAKPKSLYWHYWLPEGKEMPTLNPSNPKYALIISAWRRLPVFFTRWLGPKIVKNLP